MIDKNKMPIAIGVAFVAFTTQFGGGFASGAQLYQYFINYGFWGLFMPILAQLLLTIFYWYGMRYAFRNKTYDYGSFSNKFYGKYRAVFSPIYELTYIMLICLAPAIAFATGGSTIKAITNLPYWVCTLIVGAFIFFVSLYGTHIVRKFASTLSVIIIVSLLVVLIPNIIAQWDVILTSIGEMSKGAVPIGSKEAPSFGDALISSITYFLFQLAAVGLMYQHVQPLENEKQLNLSMIYMFIVNTSTIMLTVFGMTAIAFNDQLEGATIPMLVFVKNGVGSAILNPIVSILIILGAVSTAVNMIAGIVHRVVSHIEKNESDVIANSKRKSRSTIAALGFTLLSFSISQFGLIPLVKKGYAYLGYVTFFAVALPFIIKMIYGVVYKNKNSI